jgi:hypothetical protein
MVVLQKHLFRDQHSAGREVVMSGGRDNEVEALRTQLRHALQEDLAAWMRTRFWFAAILIGALSFFGVRGVVQQVFEGDLRDARQATQEIIVKAETAVALATDATAKAKAASDVVQAEADLMKAEIANLRREMDANASTIAEIEKRAENVTVSFNSIELRIADVKAGATTLTQGSVDAMLGRVRELESTLAEIAETVGFRKPTGETVATAQAVVATESERQLNDVLAKSEFSVWTWLWRVDPELRTQILETIKKLGFPITDVDDETYDFDRMVREEPGIDEGVAPGSIVLKINSNASTETLTYTEEIRAALEQSLSATVSVIKSPDTGNGGVQVARRSDN